MTRSNVIFGILFALGGIGGIGYGVNTVLQASRMERWPTADAVIVYSEVRVQTPDEGGSSTYIADIRYQYDVEDRTYSSDRISPASYGTSNSSRAHEQVRKYSVGEIVAAHYDPDDVSYAVLETQWDKIYLLAFGAGFGALLLGLAMLRRSSA